MKLEHNVYAKLSINGIVIQEFDAQKMSIALPSMIQSIVNHDIQTRDFSSLTIQISKRPIIDKSDEFAGLMQFAVPTDESETIPDHPDLTWKEYMDLVEDCPAFNNMRQLNQNAGKFSPEEQRAITEQFDDKYHMTKWWKLFNEVEG